eukprot:m.69909 g.69909  ORF g.69909 m.69909 type:complete len:2734 (-) comp7845_c0_seq1:204-8405(-)
MVDRLLRAIQSLQVAEDDSAARVKERIAACTTLSESICTPALTQRPASEFGKLLSITFGALLRACSDPSADVRLSADESLNRTITALAPTHLLRILIELHKAMKKIASPPKFLRAALSKFADISHLIKMHKKDFASRLASSLLPLVQIADEGLQETLPTSISKICDSLGLLFTERETQELLAAFVQNASSSSAVVRRTAADCAVAVCLGTCKPDAYLTFLFNSLFGLVSNEPEELVVLGTLLCFRKVLVSYASLRASNPKLSPIVDEFTSNKLLQLLLSCCEHKNHNVITASLETLHQFLCVLDRSLVHWFQRPEVGQHCVQVLGDFLLDTSKKTRVSIRGISMSCLAQALLYKPACYRLRLASCGRPVAHVVDEFFTDEDPLLRGNLYQLLGNLISASLQQQHFSGTHVPTLDSEDSVADMAECFSIEHLCNLLMRAMADETSTAARTALHATRVCMPALCLSGEPSLALGLLHKVFSLRTNQYWLIRIEIVEQIGSLDYILIAYLENRLQNMLENDPRHPASSVLSRFGTKKRIQEYALEIVMTLLEDDDSRVRDASTGALVSLVKRLYYPTDWPDDDPLVVLAERKMTFVLGQSAGSLSENSDDSDILPNPMLHEANLSRLMAKIVSNLYSSHSRAMLMGCYQALNALARRGISSTPAALQSSSTDTASAGSADNVLFAVDTLLLAINHLKVPWMALDLAVHIDVLGVICSICNSTQLPEACVPQLLTHVLRLLNACSHIILDTAPGPSKTQRKDSPAKAKDSPDKRSGDDGDELLLRAAPPNAGRGFFANQPHFMKIYDALRGAYNAAHISLSSDNNRFVEMTEVALDLLTVVARTKGSLFLDYVEEVLTYLPTMIGTAPSSVYRCTQQLIETIFKISPTFSLATLEAASKPPVLQRHYAPQGAGMYERCLQLSRNSDARARAHSTSRRTKSFSGRAGLPSSDSSNSLDLSDLDEALSSPLPVRPRQSRLEAIDRAQLLLHIRHFEPIVVRGLNQFMLTGDVQLQQQILMLVYHLIALRVKFEALDRKGLFLGNILAQLDAIAAGESREPERLIGYIFRFLLLRLPEEPSLSMELILKKAIAVVENPAFQPAQVFPAVWVLVQELFFDMQVVTDSTPNLESHRDVVTTLLRQIIHYPPALHQLNLLLRFYRARPESEDRFKMLSRLMVDAVLKLISAGELVFEDIRMLHHVDAMFALVAPVALRPSLLLIDKAISLAKPFVKLRNLASSFAPGEFDEKVLQQWLASTLCLWKAVIHRSNRDGDDILSHGLVSAIEQHPELDSGSHPEATLLRFFFDTIAVAAHYFERHRSSAPDFLCQMFAQLLILVQSFALHHRHHHAQDSRFDDAIGELAASAAPAICRDLQHIVNAFPLLSTLMCQLLSVLHISSPTIWQLCGLVLYSTDTGNSGGDAPPLLSTRLAVHNSCADIAQRAVFLLYCEHLAELAAHVFLTDQATPAAIERWRHAVTHITGECGQPFFEQLMHLCHERPILELFAALAMHEKDTAALVFQRFQAILQAASSATSSAGSTHGGFSQRVLVNLLRLATIGSVNESQVSFLFSLMRLSRHVFVARRAEVVLCQKLQLLADANEGTLPAAITREFAEHASCCERFPTFAASLRSRGVTLSDPEPTVEEMMAESPDDWHLRFVQSQCAQDGPHRTSSAAAVFSLLAALSPARLQLVLHNVSFDKAILGLCLRIGFKQSRWQSSVFQQHVKEDEQDDHRSLNERAQSEFTAEYVAQRDTQSTSSSAHATLSAGPDGDDRDSVGGKGGNGGSSGNGLGEGLSSGSRFLLMLSEFVLESVVELIRNRPPDFAWDQLVALADGVGIYMRAHASQTMLVDASWVGELVPERLTCLLHFSAMLAQRCSSQFPLEPRALLTVLECIDAVLADAAVQHHLSQIEHGLRPLVGVIACYMYDLFVAVTAGSTVPDPPHKRQSVEGESTEQPASEAQALPQVQDGEGADLLDADGRLCATADPSNFLDARGRHRLYMMVRRLHTELSPFRRHRCTSGVLSHAREAALPSTFLECFRQLTITMARLDLNCMHMYGLVANPETGQPSRHAAEYLAELAGPMGGEIRDELLREEPMVLSLAFRACSLGWGSNTDFMLVWEMLLSVLERSSEQFEVLSIDRREADRERALAIRGMTSILVYALKTPAPGEPTSSFRTIPRVRDIPFLHTESGQKLMVVQTTLVEDAEHIFRAETSRPTPQPVPYHFNVERATDHTRYSYGQVSSTCLRVRGGATRQMRRMFGADWFTPCLEQLTATLLRFLPSSEPVSLVILREITRSLCVLSDVFTRPDMFRWLLHTLLDVHRKHPSEDAVILSTTLPALCKALAVVEPADVTEHADAVVKLFTDALQSALLSSQLGALVGFLYLLEGRISNIMTSQFSTLTQYLLHAMTSARDARHLLYVYAVAFALIETHPSEIDANFAPSIVRGAAELVAAQAAVPHALLSCIVHGLDRLLLSFALGKPERDTVAAIANTSATKAFCRRSVLGLQLTITSMYCNKDLEMPSAGAMDTSAAPLEEMDTVSLVTMERISSIFNYTRRCDQRDIRIVKRVLPLLMDDFFPPRQIMNIVMGELTVTQRPHPENIAVVVHNMFEILQRQGQQPALREWVVLSISSFLQRVPRSLAVSSLACLFVSVSEYGIIRSLLDWIVNETQQRRSIPNTLFWMPAMHFLLNGGLTDEGKHMFLNILSSKTVSPYLELVRVCERLSSQMLSASDTSLA